MKETLNPGERFGYLRRVYEPQRKRAGDNLRESGINEKVEGFKKARARFAREFVRMQGESREDSLTGLLNRRGFEERLHEVAQRSIRNNVKFMLVYLDANDLKSINDKDPLKHAAGDQLLRNIGNVLKDNVRDIDFVARIGGDEFAVVLDSLDEDRFKLWVRRLRSALRDHKINLPAGAILLDPASIDRSKALADNLLYLAKAESKRQKEIVTEKLEGFAKDGVAIRLFKGRSPFALGIRK